MRIIDALIEGLDEAEQKLYFDLVDRAVVSGAEGVSVGQIARLFMILALDAIAQDIEQAGGNKEDLRSHIEDVLLPMALAILDDLAEKTTSQDDMNSEACSTKCSVVGETSSTSEELPNQHDILEAVKEARGATKH